MAMRILHTGDWHLGRTLEGRSRLPEQEAFLDELVAVAREESVDLVLVAGDVYDSVNPPAAAEELFYDALFRLSDGGRRAVVVIAGNHDHPERVAAAAPLAMRHAVHLVGLPRKATVRVAVPRTGEEAVIAALPFPSEARLHELLHGGMDERTLRAAYSDRVGQLLREMAADFRPDTVNLVMSHLYVLGGEESDSERPIQVGGAYTVHPDALAVGQQYTALGHLHRPQRVGDDDTVRYSGSPLAYSFSEAGQAKSVTLVETAPGRPAAVRNILLSSGRPLVRWEARGGLAEVYRWLEENRDPDAWIELNIWLTEALTHEQIGRLRASREGIVQIRPVYAGASGAEPDAAGWRRSELSPDELFRRFYRKQTGGAEPEDELVALFLELVAENEREEASAP